MASKTVPRRAALKLVQFGTSDMMVTEVCGGTMTWGSDGGGGVVQLETRVETAWFMRLKPMG